jgi:hypothetical protein
MLLILALKFFESENKRLNSGTVLIATPARNILLHWCIIMNISYVIYCCNVLFETSFQRFYLFPCSRKVLPPRFNLCNKSGNRDYFSRLNPTEWPFNIKMKKCPVSEKSSQNIASMNYVQKMYHLMGNLWTSTVRNWVHRGRLFSTEIVYEGFEINYSYVIPLCIGHIISCVHYKIFVLYTNTYSYPGRWCKCVFSEMTYRGWELPVQLCENVHRASYFPNLPPPPKEIEFLGLLGNLQELFRISLKLEIYLLHGIGILYAFQSIQL